MIDETLTKYRLEHAEAKARLRLLEDQTAAERARALIGFIAVGRNADERDRELALHLVDSDEWQRYQNIVLDVRRAIDMLAVRIEERLDIRRDYEWKVRLRLAEALLRVYGPVALDGQNDLARDLHTSAGLTDALTEGATALAGRGMERRLDDDPELPF